LVNFCRRWREELWSNRSSEIRDPNARRISAALRLMHTHPARRWTVSKLAADVGLSRSSFAQEFAHCLESTPLAYLTEVRMKRAAYLLEQGRISCQEVAIRVGYSLENSFSRAFKRRFGFSPRAYAAAMCGEQVAEHVPFGDVELARGLAPPCVGDLAKLGTSAVAANEHPRKSTLAIHEVLSAVAAPDEDGYFGTKCA
jgi:AraC-like DNA-binding protein